MKNLVSYLIIGLCILSMCLLSNVAEASAANLTATAPKDLKTVLRVSEKELDTSMLPKAPYAENNTYMVPLRLVAEALGYTVTWDEKSGAVTVEDAYTQIATLYEGTAEVSIKGKLKVIDLSREIKNACKTVIFDGVTYVPMEFFEEFFNHSSYKDGVIEIAPDMAYLD